MFKVIIAGGRDFDHWKKDYGNGSNLYLLKIDKILSDKHEHEIEMVTGTAKGADQIPYFYKIWHGYSITEFPADWDTHGKSAGYIRNKQMADYADALICFWDGISHGTKNMIEVMESLNKPVRIVRY